MLYTKTVRKKIIYIVAGLCILAGILLYSTGQWRKIYLFIQHTYFLMHLSVPSTAGSSIETRYFPAAHLGNKMRTLRVYLPPHYTDDENRRYPVLYLLHGDPGDQDDWLINGHIQQTLDSMIVNKQLPPLIVVFPDGQGTTILDGQYLDSESQNQFLESYLTTDVIGYIDSTYRTNIDRAYRAIGGISSGGYGAVNSAVHHSELFSVVLSQSGYFEPLGSTGQKLLQNNSDLIAYNSPPKFIEAHSIDQPLNVYLQVGQGDTEYYHTQTKQLYDALQEKNIPASIDVVPGGHGWGTWSVSIQNALMYLASKWQYAYEPAPKPSPLPAAAKPTGTPNTGVAK